MGLLVNEIFSSIQGESTFAGRPCTFIRLTGCNLACTYCDTAYAKTDGVLMTIEDVLDRVKTCDLPLVEITGGEPLLQPETPILVQRLLSLDYTVLMETNGSMNIGLVDKACIKIIDMKCPSSGQSEFMDLENLSRMDVKDEVKFVIGNRSDYEYAKNLTTEAGKCSPESPLLFSPVFGKLDPAILSSWILEDHLNVRLQIQLHKIIWPDRDRGV